MMACQLVNLRTGLAHDGMVHSTVWGLCECPNSEWLILLMPAHLCCPGEGGVGR